MINFLVISLILSYVLRCFFISGEIYRGCSATGVWNPPVYECVSTELSTIEQQVRKNVVINRNSDNDYSAKLGPPDRWCYQTAI
jgi:hypothetical protein